MKYKKSQLVSSIRALCGVLLLLHRSNQPSEWAIYHAAPTMKLSQTLQTFLWIRQYVLHFIAIFCIFGMVFTPDSIYAIARICYRPSVRLPVCPSVRLWYHRKTVEVRIMTFSPYGSPITLVSVG